MQENQPRTTAAESSASSALLAGSSCEAELRTIAKMRGDGQQELSIGWKAADEIAALRKALTEATANNDVCVWQGDDNWNTGCGHHFIIIDGGPTDNSMKFCCYCGKAIKEADTTWQENYR